MNSERLNRVLSNFRIQSCPVVEGRRGCVITCGGGWPGTKATSETLTKAALNGRLDPKKLGCGTLQNNARVGLEQLEEYKENSEEL